MISMGLSVFVYEGGFDTTHAGNDEIEMVSKISECAGAVNATRIRQGLRHERPNWHARPWTDVDLLPALSMHFVIS